MKNQGQPIVSSSHKCASFLQTLTLQKQLVVRFEIQYKSNSNFA